MCVLFECFRALFLWQKKVQSAGFLARAVQTLSRQPSNQKPPTSSPQIHTRGACVRNKYTMVSKCCITNTSLLLVFLVGLCSQAALGSSAFQVAIGVDHAFSLDFYPAASLNENEDCFHSHCEQDDTVNFYLQELFLDSSEDPCTLADQLATLPSGMCFTA